MTVYVLAQMTITAPSRYNRYRDAFLRLTGQPLDLARLGLAGAVN